MYVVYLAVLCQCLALVDIDTTYPGSFVISQSANSIYVAWCQMDCALDSREVFIAKYDRDLQLVWRKCLGPGEGPLLLGADRQKIALATSAEKDSGGRLYVLDNFGRLLFNERFEELAGKKMLRPTDVEVSEKIYLALESEDEAIVMVVDGKRCRRRSYPELSFIERMQSYRHKLYVVAKGLDYTSVCFVFNRSDAILFSKNSPCYVNYLSVYRDKPIIGGWSPYCGWASFGDNFFEVKDGNLIGVVDCSGSPTMLFALIDRFGFSGFEVIYAGRENIRVRYVESGVSPVGIYNNNRHLVVLANRTSQLGVELVAYRLSGRSVFPKIIQKDAEIIAILEDSPIAIIRTGGPRKYRYQIIKIVL